MSTNQPLVPTVYSIDEVRARVDRLIQQWFATQISRAQPVGPEYVELWQTMLELSQAGGKRIRPYLTVLSYQAFGGKHIDALLPVAAAQELLHLSLLVHDDIIDRDYTRYGQANIAGTYRAKYTAHTPDAEHYAQSAALLAGDLLLSGSYQLTLASQLPPERLTAIFALLGTAIFEVGGGEFLDTIAAFSAIDTVDSLHVADYKTASYSFVAPLIIGATAANADQSALATLTKLGKSLGIAYQLSDDLLGTFGDPAKTGKPSDSDIREGKRTYLLQRTFELCDSDTRARLEKLLNTADMSDKDVASIRARMVQSGAKEDVIAKMHQCAKEGKTALTSLNLAPAYTQVLTGLIEKAIWRDH